MQILLHIRGMVISLQRKSHLCIPRKGSRGLSPNFHIHVSVSTEQFIYSHDRSAYLVVLHEATFMCFIYPWLGGEYQGGGEGVRRNIENPPIFFIFPKLKFIFLSKEI